MFIEVYKSSDVKSYEELQNNYIKQYELRIVIREVFNVPLINTTSVNIKIKLVISKNGSEEIKETDVHNNSTNGWGEFNWRFVDLIEFPSKYSYKFQVFHVNMFSKDEKIAEKPIRFDKQIKEIHNSKDGKNIKEENKKVKMGN